MLKTKNIGMLLGPLSIGDTHPYNGKDEKYITSCCLITEVALGTKGVPVVVVERISPEVLVLKTRTSFNCQLRMFSYLRDIRDILKILHTIVLEQAN